MKTTEKIISVKNLDKTFEIKASKVRVLKNINLDINKGEFIVITGPSGCGKSTLLHILLGLESPTNGTLTFLGHNLYGNSSEDQRTDIRKSQVGMVYQQPNWIKSLTVLENVMFALRINGATHESAYDDSLAMLKIVGMDKWQDYTPTELSSGQQQKVALARAVVTNPQIIIADEPTGNLDFNSGKELMELLQKYNSQGKTIIMVTHDLEYLTYATRSLIMFDGEIVGDADKKELVGKLGSFKKLMKTVETGTINEK